MPKKLSDFSVQVVREVTNKSQVVPLESESRSIKIDFELYHHIRNDAQQVVYRDRLIRYRWRDMRKDFPSQICTINTIKDYLHQAGLSDPESDEFIRSHLLPILNRDENKNSNHLSITVNMNSSLRESVRLDGIRNTYVGNNCSICLERLSESPDLNQLPCSHVFHRRCIEPWLFNKSHRCPLCNSPMPIRQFGTRALEPAPAPIQALMPIQPPVPIPIPVQAPVPAPAPPVQAPAIARLQSDENVSSSKYGDGEWIWVLAKAIVFVKLGQILLK